MDLATGNPVTEQHRRESTAVVRALRGIFINPTPKLGGYKHRDPLAA